ncbi:MAG: hypothetical protein ACR2MF_07285 [Chthoniobacterales bacterium]
MSPQEVQRNEVHFPDDYSPSPDSTTFTKTDWWDSPAAIGTNFPAGLLFTLPDDMVGVIRFFAQYVNDMIAGDDIRWTIRINETAYPNWNDVKMFPTIASFRNVGDDPFIHIPEGGKVDVMLNNTTGLAKRIGASYSGWFWPNRKRGN